MLLRAIEKYSYVKTFGVLQLEEKGASDSEIAAFKIFIQNDIDFFKKQSGYRKSDDDDDYKPAPGDAKAKTKPSGFTKKFKQMYGEVKDINETIKAVQNKAKKTGMPYSILKQVYNRGMAAWKGGHRPGATQQQWALARVNSFVTKSSGTWGGADKDLAKKVRAAKK